MTSCLITASEVTYQLLTAEGGRDVFLKCARPPARLYPAAAARTAGRGGGRPPSFLSLVLVREGAGRTGLSLREARGGFPRVPLSGFELRCCGKGRRQTSLRPPASGGRFGGSRARDACPARVGGAAGARALGRGPPRGRGALTTHPARVSRGPAFSGAGVSWPWSLSSSRISTAIAFFFFASKSCLCENDWNEFRSDPSTLRSSA